MNGAEVLENASIFLVLKLSLEGSVLGTSKRFILVGVGLLYRYKLCIGARQSVYYSSLY